MVSISALCVAATVSGCGRELLYSVSVANYGDYGIIIRELPVKLNRPAEIEPGIPGVRSDIYEKSYLRGYPDSLPPEVEVVWQLAKLQDCKRFDSSKSFIDDQDGRIYTRKHGCAFMPIEGKVFRQVVDLNKIMETEAGQRAGKLVKPWWTLSRARYGLSIAFEFRDEELQVRALTYRTNPWK